MDTPWTDDHSRAIAAAAPPAPEATDAELDRTWATVRAGISASPKPRRNRMRMFLAAALAAATVAVGGVATAEMYTARTGKGPIDAEDERLGGPGEKLDPSAADFGTVIDEETTDIPFPNNDARAISRERLVEQFGGEPRGFGGLSTGAMRYWTARSALCSWGNAWVAAEVAGDEAASAKAAAMLVAAPDWPAVTDVDPKQTMDYIWQDVYDPETRTTTREKTRNETPAFYFPLARDAVKDEDIDDLGRVLAYWGVCDPALVPDFPQAIAEPDGPWRD